MKTQLPRRACASAVELLAEAALLLAVPVAMAIAFVSRSLQPAPLMMLVVALALLLFFLGFERSRPGLRQIMPTLVMAALAAAGRILFAPVPSFKPLSAIAIIAGAVLGRRAGFMIGSMAALTSNFFFGQGMWTPWQMFPWGVIGYLGGVLADTGLLARADGRPRRGVLALVGVASGLLFGAVINLYDIIGFVRPFTWQGAAARLATAVPFDLVHGASTAVFLLALYGPWTRRIERVVRKYDVRMD